MINVDNVDSRLKGIGALNGCHGLGYGKNDVFVAFQTILTSMFSCPGYQEDAISMNNLTISVTT